MQHRKQEFVNRRRKLQWGEMEVDAARESQPPNQALLSKQP
jgi:hypothetical protein